MTYTDLAYERGRDGLYDLAIGDDADLKKTTGLDSSIFVSLFSDRRARVDEVVDWAKRRGWIGDLVSEVPDDRHGSGLWLYEQRRLTRDVAVGVRLEAEQALQWMVQERLVKVVTAEVRAEPDKRRISLTVKIGHPDGGQSVKAYVLADATVKRSLFTLASDGRFGSGDARRDVLEWGGEPIDWDLGIHMEWD